MPVTTFRNNMNDLVKWGIVYRAQASFSDANSYRLTDAAFKLSQTLQNFALFCEWQNYLGHENTLLSNSEWGVFMNTFENMPKGYYQQWFTKWMYEPTTQNLIQQWHQSDDETGQRLCPSLCGIRDHARKPVADFIESIQNEAADSELIDLSNPAGWHLSGT